MRGICFLGFKMGIKDKIIVFGGKKIRRVWYKDEWWFSVVDVVGVLTDSFDFQRARKYWNKLSQRLCEEGSEVVTICHQLKMCAQDGKMRETDSLNKKGIFRIIQSIPSKKAEPFKMWLAKVGSERIDEIENPELAQERMKKLYEQKGYPKDWIDKRLRGIVTSIYNYFKNQEYIFKIKGVQTELDQCDQFTQSLPQDIKMNIQNYLNVLVLDKARMAERSMRLVYAQFSSHGNGGSKLRVSESPSPGVQNMRGAK